MYCSAAAKEDAAALAHDRLIHPPPGTHHKESNLLLWEGSDADHWLRVDMYAQKHRVMTKEQLFATRDCYKPFGKIRFGKRIDQLLEAAKPVGATPGQHKSGKMPRGLKGRSRKSVLDKYINDGY